MIHIKKTNSEDPDFIHLVELLDADLAIRDGEDHAFYNQFNGIDQLKNVVVAYENDQAIGCGAIKSYTNDTVEIKRMYVKETHRGKGFASKILIALEQWAKTLQNQRCILETGTKQPEAIRLYEKNGYTPIENYDQYAGVANSICMEKML